MFITGISFFSGLILIFFSIILFWRKSALQRASRLLAVTLFLLACWDFSIVYFYYALFRQSELLLSFYFPVNFILSLCISPAVYFYMQLLFEGNGFRWKKQFRYHAIVLLPAVLFLFYFVSIPVPDRIAMLLNESFDADWRVISISILFYIQLLSYFLFCFLKVRKNRKANYLLQVDHQIINIHWLEYLFLFAIVLLGIYIFISALNNAMQFQTFVQMCVIDAITLYIFIQSVWFTGLSMQNAAVSTPKDETASPAPSVLSFHVPGTKIHMSEQQGQAILQTLAALIEEKQMYLSKKCLLEDVAASANIPLHLVSHAVNHFSEYNFTDFINKYRVDHACKLLSEGFKQKLTLEAIGLECGFGSRTNFYNVFKKVTGKTPAKYYADCKKAIITVEEMKTIPEKYNAAPSEEIAEAF